MEYVTKAELKPWHKLFIGWIDKIREDVRKKGVTFECVLVGSAKRHLVIKHHNKGFDLDFQIIIRKNKKKIDCKELKEMLIDLFNDVIDDDFNYCEDSTSSIEIKMVDQNNSAIKVSYDVVIIRKIKANEKEETEILRHHKDTDTWKFELLKDMTNASKQFKKINGNQMWQNLRERYYSKKTKNKDGKKSFQLLHEAVNETLDKFE